nr:ArgE/DapE family deacylase [uncultured Dongia sp.]
MLDQSLAKDIIAAIDAGFDAQLKETMALVSLPSLRGQEATAQDFMARHYRNRGLAVDHWKINVADIQHLPGFSPVAVSYDNAYNVVATHHPRETKGRSLILNGHIDVVPTGPHDLWTRPPFDSYVTGDWLYGRGSGDMKAGLYGCLAAFDALDRIGLRPAAEVYLQSVVEEECTGNGALACLQRGYRGEAALIPEPSGDAVMHAQLGVMWFQVKVRGRPTHVGHAGTGSNAIEAAFPIVAKLHELEERWNAEKHAIWTDHKHPINFVVSRIEGGDWTSSVPAWCTFDMRISFYPGMELARVRQDVEATVRAAAAGHSFLANNPPEVVYHGFQAEPYVLKNADAALACLESAHRQVFDADLPRIAATATTDARFFGLYADTPALVYGPVSEDYHGFDERVSISSLKKITAGMALFMADWCGVEKK